MIRKLTTLKAIRRKCLDCCAGSANEVKLCGAEDCPLYAYRFGKIPSEVPTYDDGVVLTEKEVEKRKENGRRLREILNKKRAKKITDINADENENENEDENETDIDDEFAPEDTEDADDHDIIV